MSFDNTLGLIFDPLLDELELDICGFADSATESSQDSFSYSQASTSAVYEDVASTDDDEFPPNFELLEEIPLPERRWVAAGPPAWDTVPVPLPIEDSLIKRANCLRIDIPPPSPSRAGSRPLPKENLTSPTSPGDGKYARLRSRGSSLALRAFNSTLGSPEVYHRVLV